MFGFKRQPSSGLLSDLGSGTARGGLMDDASLQAKAQKGLLGDATVMALLGGEYGPAARPPVKPMHVAPGARRNGNVEDRRGLPFDRDAFERAFYQPERFDDWAEDEWMQAVKEAFPADPGARAERAAVLYRQGRLNPPPAPAPAWSATRPTLGFRPSAARR